MKINVRYLKDGRVVLAFFLCFYFLNKAHILYCGIYWKLHTNSQQQVGNFRRSS